MKKWLSRKLLAAIGGVFVPVLVKTGLPETDVQTLIAAMVPIVAYILGQSHVDATEAKNGGKKK